MSGLRALLLDFDGLVCDTEQAAHDSWVHTYARFGLPFPRQLWVRMVGRRDGEELAKQELVSRLGRSLPDTTWAHRRRYKRLLADRTPARPGVVSFLDAGAARGCALAVVSSSSRSWLTAHLTRLGLHDRFTLIVSGDDGPRHKPAPDLYLLALVRLGLRPCEAVAFEDSAVGVAAARAAGIRCVAVPNGTGTAEQLASADVVLTSLGQIDLNLLEGVGYR